MLGAHPSQPKHPQPSQTCIILWIYIYISILKLNKINQLNDLFLKFI